MGRILPILASIDLCSASCAGFFAGNEWGLHNEEIECHM